jgi:hypothetical protein
LIRQEAETTNADTLRQYGSRCAPAHIRALKKFAPMASDEVYYDDISPLMRRRKAGH